MTIGTVPRLKMLGLLGAALLCAIIALAAIATPAQACATNNCAQPDRSGK